ncbi:MAG: ATP-binding cassette domain-containing protein, partial [Pseudomonadota bacterium]|nr:ATP-binding cassette domain-containing protein [Pseudomonadota bacterium]
MADLLTVKDLRVKFKVHGGTVDAVKGASLTIRKGSTVALVGESGSGKSVISQCIMGILPEVGEIIGGELLFAPSAMLVEVTPAPLPSPPGQPAPPEWLQTDEDIITARP